MAEIKKGVLTVEIKDVQEVPGRPGVYLVSVRFTDNEASWFQTFKMIPERTWTLDEFKVNLLGKMQRGEIVPNASYLDDIKAAIDEPFLLDVHKETINPG